MKNYIFIFLLFINLIFLVRGDIQCNTFVDSTSNTDPKSCGSSLNQACSIISQSIINCGTFDEITITISPGNYSINNETFGSITNKKITILNSQQPINQPPSVIIDLSKSISPFIQYIPLTINDTLTVSLNGITFENGIQKGSVLLNNGSGIINLSVVNCAFINMLDSGYGSTFTFINGSNIQPTTNGIVTISQSTFSSSNSNSYGGYLYSYNLPIKITIDQSKFLGFNVSGNGYCVSVYNGFLSVSNSMVIGVNSKYPFLLQKKDGIKSNTTSTTFTFNNVTFNNLSDSFGILIFGDKTTTTLIKNCTFVNSINFSPIFIQGIGQSTIESCTFTNNTNSNSNLGSSGGITIQKTTSIITDCLFLNNYAMKGGAISTSSCDPQGVTITNSTFQGNGAQYDGGSIYNTNCNTTINNVDFSSLATNISTVYCLSSNMVFSSSNFTVAGKEINDISNLGIICKSDSCSITIDSNEINSQSSNDNDNDKGLSTTKKVLIAIGIIAVSIIIIMVVILIIRKVKRNREYKPFGY
ncbi:hypothetical protein ACTA71_011451 [Dictyostelium dimigraforme]